MYICKHPYMKPIKHMKAKKKHIEMYLRTLTKEKPWFCIVFTYSNRSMNMCIKLNILVQYELYF